MPRRQTLDLANTKQSDTEKKAGSSTFVTAEKKLSDARIAFNVAQDVLDHTNGVTDGTSLHDSAQTALDDAKINLDNAQRDYDDALTTDGAKDVLTARADAMVALERYNTAIGYTPCLANRCASPRGCFS